MKISGDFLVMLFFFRTDDDFTTIKCGKQVSVAGVLCMIVLSLLYCTNKCFKADLF